MTIRLLITSMAALFALPASAQAQRCAEACLSPGDSDQIVAPDLVPRTFKVHVPTSYDGKRAVPLVLDFHGFSSDATEERSVSGQLQQSDKRGFIVVFPEGLARSWNGYGCCSTSKATEVNDVRFARTVIDWVKARANIDATRVYVTGISNGGSMAHRMACEAADVVRAVAAVSFPLNLDRCIPRKPITVYSIAGTADTTIPYDGAKPDAPVSNVAGVPVRIQSAPASLAAWKGNDGCSSRVTSSAPIPGEVLEDVYRQCSGGVRTGLLTIVGGRHVLYNGYRGLTGSYSGDNAPIDVSEYIWTNVFNK
jgi:polyhydroxybutyrate depolymerase